MGATSLTLTADAGFHAKEAVHALALLQSVASEDVAGGEAVPSLAQERLPTSKASPKHEMKCQLDGEHRKICP